MADQNLIPPNLPVAEDSPKPAQQQGPNIKSFIRTMEDDIKSAKQGVISKGAEVVIPESAPLPSVSFKTGPQAPKPATPAPLIRLGEVKKRSVLPEIKPMPPVIKKEVEPAKTIVVPPKKTSFLSKTAIFVIAGAVLVGAGAYWFFILKPASESVVTSSTTPLPTGTPDPLKELKSLFLINNPVILSTPISVENLPDFYLKISQAVTNEQIIHTFINPRGDDSLAISFSGFITKFLTGSEESASKLLNSVFDSRFGLIYSKQEEIFGESGNLLSSALAEKRLALTVEVSDVIEAQKAMLAWEGSLPFDLEHLFKLDKVNEVGNLAFLDNAYREVSIRYVNFPYPDRSIDYAIVGAANGKNYLVIANSRAQIYSIIDTLLGF